MLKLNSSNSAVLKLFKFKVHLALDLRHLSITFVNQVVPNLKNIFFLLQCLLPCRRDRW